METLVRDLRFALRVMRRNPGVTAIAVLALALGSGANSAIFSAVHAVLLRPLPHIRDSDRIVQISGSSPAKNVPYHQVFYSDVVYWRDRSRSFESMQAATFAQTNLREGEQPEQLPMARVNAGFFSMLGTPFFQGRGFIAEEDRPGAPLVAVISHGLWQRRFNSDRGILGRTLLLDGRGHTVVGVLPPGFQFTGGSLDVYVPLALPSVRTPGDSTTVTAYARLKPGVSVGQAQAEMDMVGRQLNEENPRTIGQTPRVWDLRGFLVRNVRLSLLVLVVAVGVVLLIACANVANLLLARAGARQREIAVRRTMGATRSDLVRQMLTESAVLGLAGGAAGILLAWVGVRALIAISPERYPFLQDASVNAAVLAFTAAVSLATGLLFGLAPALAASRTGRLHETLKEGGRSSSQGRAHSRMRSTLVVAEVALALILLAGAGLMIRSFSKLNHVDPGFDPRRVLSAAISLPASKYAKVPERVLFYNRLLKELDQPGVEAAGIVSSLPLLGHNTGTGLFIEGRPAPRPADIPIMWYRVTSPGYFRALRIPLKQGRLFTERDDHTAPPVAVINETMARRHWPGENPIGKHFLNNRPPTDRPFQWMTVIGVAGDLRHRGLNEPAEAEAFFPYTQLGAFASSVNVVVLTRGQPEAFAPSLRRAVAAVDREQSVARLRGLEQIVADSIAPQRLAVSLMSVFAAVALALAGVGIYGVVSFSVSRRTQEIGVRMALGAARGQVARMVVGQAVLLAGIGVAIGLAVSLLLTRFLRSVLYEVSATDPAVFAAMSILLVGVAALAGYVPARRAAGVDPTTALRYE